MNGDAVAEQVPNIQRELTSIFRAKLLWEGEVWRTALEGTYTDLPES
jgi:hypothetical protein